MRRAVPLRTGRELDLVIARQLSALAANSDELVGDSESIRKEARFHTARSVHAVAVRKDPSKDRFEHSFSVLGAVAQVAGSSPVPRQRRGRHCRGRAADSQSVGAGSSPVSSTVEKQARLAGSIPIRTGVTPRRELAESSEVPSQRRRMRTVAVRRQGMREEPGSTPGLRAMGWQTVRGIGHQCNTAAGPGDRGHHNPAPGSIPGRSPLFLTRAGVDLTHAPGEESSDSRESSKRTTARGRAHEGAGRRAQG